MAVMYGNSYDAMDVILWNNYYRTQIYFLLYFYKFLGQKEEKAFTYEMNADFGL